ncbi:MAG: hypothetical protein LUI60_05730 [Clostridia bacterium]|nr:hypothetical protein [Clostridia bacterium]
MRCVKTFLLLILAFAACTAVTILPQRLVFAQGESYTFYCGNTSSDCKIVTAVSNAALYKLTLNDICGESTTYPDLDAAAFISSVNGEIIFTEELSDSVNYYCKADLPFSVILYGTEINLHICVKQCGVTVASPIIFGGY